MSLSLRDVNKSRYSFPDGYDSVEKSKRTLHPSANAKPLFIDEQLPRSIDAIFAPLEENEGDDDDENNDSRESSIKVRDLRIIGASYPVCEFAPINDSREGSRALGSMGTSLRLDSQGIVKFSIREEAISANTPQSNVSFLPSVMTSFSSALDMLYDLIHDHILVPTNDRDFQVEIASYTGTADINIFITPLKRKISNLVEILMHLNHIELTLAVFKQWGSAGIEPTQSDRFNTCLHDLLEMISNYVNEGQYNVSIFQQFINSREFAKKIQFIQVADDAIAEVRPLLFLTNIPQLTSQIFKFDVQLTASKDCSLQEELRYHINYMLIYQLFVQKLRGFFVSCLSLEKKEESGIVLRCLEGFLTNCVEIDSAELLVGLDSAVDEWAQKDNDRVIILSSWCREMARKHNKPGKENYEDQHFSNENKYNVAKLFIQQLKDLAIGNSLSPGFTILTAGLDTAARTKHEDIIKSRSHHGKSINVKKWGVGQQKPLSHKQRLFEKCQRLKWRLVKWSHGLSRSKRASELQFEAQQLDSTPKCNNSDLISLSIRGTYHNWRSTYENTTYNEFKGETKKSNEQDEKGKKFEELKRRRDRFMYLFFGDDA
ncbi:HFL015Cp [Eremothecium sinecaudum]|uniref:HFL015Cp n=1 Tax=Eremothecium sinecaudum TaxID=45286 RepID=A0A109UXT8_9SACH|nr:HFL015Cp [Eremothecium sinecaudum]AMD21841.1 HFL015Cp [Eremothecium sinecaudum]